MTDSRLAPSQWETSLQSNAVFYWWAQTQNQPWWYNATEPGQNCFNSMHNSIGPSNFESKSVKFIAVISYAVGFRHTVYPKKYAHGFVVLCFVVVMQSFIINSHEVCIHIHQGCFAGTGAIVRLPQCQWSKPDGYGKISQCITTTKHSKAKTVCIFLGIYCNNILPYGLWFILLQDFKS